MIRLKTSLNKSLNRKYLTILIQIRRIANKIKKLKKRTITKIITLNNKYKALIRKQFARINITRAKHSSKSCKTIKKKYRKKKKKQAKLIKK